MNILDAIKQDTNYTTTFNGAITHKTTLDPVLDLFAQGAAMRNCSEEEIVTLFRKAYFANPLLALKCLFYIRNIRGLGQGERRFFRVCLHWLGDYDVGSVASNIQNVVHFGRWDDLYALVGTKSEACALDFLANQLRLDLDSTTPSLAAKWAASCNASSEKTKQLGKITYKHMGLSSREYRKMLTILRSRINVLETLMSQNRWSEIQYDKIPSRAGLIYKNAFAVHDCERYKEFVSNKNTKVNASALYPYEIVDKALNIVEDYDVLLLEKYWEALPNYCGDNAANILCVVDVSGSMYFSKNSVKPLSAAISLGLYCAERLNGPFKNHFITFSSDPELVKISGNSLADKIYYMYHSNWGGSTNIEATFDLLLDSAIHHHLTQEDIPETLIILSDMEFDQADCDANEPLTLMEQIAKRWRLAGYECPRLVFWNLNSIHDNIPAITNGKYAYVSGFSPSIMTTILSGKNNIDLMLETLNNPIFDCVKDTKNSN